MQLFEAAPYSKPYTVMSPIHDAHIISSSWTNNRSDTTWTTYAGYPNNTGKALGLPSTATNPSVITLAVTVDSGYAMSVESFSFYNRSSATGFKSWSMTINGIEVGSDTTFVDCNGCNNPVRSTGTVSVANPANNLTGTVNVVITLTNKGTGSSGTFRIDDFKFNGYIIPVSDAGSSGMHIVNNGSYRYGFNGQEKSDEIKGEGNSYTALFWEYDSRLGRRWNVDSKPTVGISEYSAFNNNPVWYKDPLGDTTYLYNIKGIYKGVLYDGQKTNEIVILKQAIINGILKGREKGLGDDDYYSNIARDPKIATARITSNSIQEITAKWKESGENVGLLYVDKKTKELHAILSRRSGNNQGGTQTNIEGLGKDYPEVSKLGTVIGMWHSHPTKNTYSGANPSDPDHSDPTYISAFNGTVQLGIVTQKDLITIFPISRPVTQYTENKQDGVTTPKYGPKYSGAKSSFQYGTFNKNISPKTYWEQ